MPTKSLETLREHGAHGYNMGCKCDDCHDGMLRRSRRYRRSKHRAAGVRLKPCPYCDLLFHPRGLTTHELHCTG